MGTHAPPSECRTGRRDKYLNHSRVIAIRKQLQVPASSRQSAKISGIFTAPLRERERAKRTASAGRGTAEAAVILSLNGKPDVVDDFAVLD